MNIFIEYVDTKFINSLPDMNAGDLNVVVGDINKNLYQIHYRYNFDVYIFCSSKFSSEIHQFCSEFSNDKKIIIYHNDTDHSDIIDAIPQNCMHLLQKNMPKLINKHIFYNHHVTRNQDIVCFLDGYDKVPQELTKLLYPNTKMNIKIYSKNIRNIHNIGYASEKEKAMILNQSSAYLSIDDYYDIEANECGCKVMRIDNDKLVEKSVDINNHSTYTEFFVGLVK